MFGMGFTEIMLIMLVAIIALGPEKLPTAMVEVAKFFKGFKKGVTDAKDAIDKEVNLAELKEHAQDYQKSLEHTKNTIIEESGIHTAEAEMKKLNEQLKLDDTKDTPKEKENKAT
jgi:sec-independent protein translocase protein TatB